MDKLKDLLKQVDKDTRRCIVFLNNKMDDQFKRVMNIKTVSVSQPQSVDVTELRTELRKENDELKSYVKSRDKVNKDAIKKMEEKIESILSAITVKKDRLKSTYKSSKEFSPSLAMEMSEKELSEYLAPEMEFAVESAIESEILTLVDGKVMFHQNFIDTIRKINNNDLRWLNYITRLNSKPTKFDHEISFDRSIELFRISIALVEEHMREYGIVMKPIKLFCITDAVTAMFLWFVTDNFSHTLPAEEEIVIMGQNRENWLPIQVALHFSLEFI